MSTLLIFNLDDASFGLDVMLVRESVWLPELKPIEEAPPYIAGIFSLRNQFVPVIDLNLRFGHPARPYRLSDQIVVLEVEDRLTGLIVSEVREVIELSAEAIQPPPTFEGEAPRPDRLVLGEARVGDDIVTLLDASQLMHHEWLEAGEEHSFGHFCPQATPEEHGVFRARAKALLEATTEEKGVSLALAVVELGGEYFGFELEAVQEFCDIIRPSPIPCCPPHILGAISLRGNLFTLLDLRGALNLPRTTRGLDKAVIARLGEHIVGVAVDQVHDVIYLQEEDLRAAPAALREQHGTEVKGTASYAGKLLAVLDLSALLAREEWIVNETV